MAIGKQRPSLAGLTNALLPNTEDPTGIALQTRARVTRDAFDQRQEATDYGTDGSIPDVTAQAVHATGPLPDPKWEGFLQAMRERGVTRIGQDVARPEGLADDPEWATSGDVGALQQAGIPYQPLMKSNNLARPSMRGLQKAVR